MSEITPEKQAEFLRRSYLAVDGLWFIRTEEELGYETALKLDELVWEIMPKLQARRARELLGITGDTVNDLADAICLKFTAEGYEYEKELNNGKLTINIPQCPWLSGIRRAGREQIAKEICTRICIPEISGWEKQFPEAGKFRCDSIMSERACCCKIIFE